MTNQIPTLPAYGEAEFHVDVGLSLFNGLRFLQSVLQSPRKELNYRLTGKIEVAGVQGWGVYCPSLM